MGSPMPNGHASTPPQPQPTEQPNPTTLANNIPQPQPQPQPQQPQNPTMPLTSLQDDGDTKRPKDARVIHLVLASLGIQSYQERVPLQLLDFAYRYSSGVLSDALRLSAEGYTNAGGNERGGRRGGAGAAAGDAAAGGGERMTVTSLRQAISSRQGYAFEGALPKEVLLEQAQVRNAVALPVVEKGMNGVVQLPREDYCLTGNPWGLREAWSDDESMDDGEDGEANVNVNGVKGGMVNGGGLEDQSMGGMDGDEDEEGGGTMEDVFGEDGRDDGMQG